VLIKVRASSVNSWDWDRLTGIPRLYRLLHGLFKPRLKILGADIAGIVENTGKGVTGFHPGNEVFGDLCADHWGGFAEYVCAQEKSLIFKPAGISFEEAASLPQAGVMALQGIFEYGQVQAGQQVLINGTGRGVCSFAIQLAKLRGAVVTAVDHTDKLEFMRSLGADHVVDYTSENFTHSGRQYDFILDVTAKHSITSYKRVLTSRGRYSMVGGSVSSILQAAFLGWMISEKNGRKLGILVHQPNKDLGMLAELVVAGKLKPIINHIYPLSKVPEAMKLIGEGKAIGKVIITI